MEKMNQEEIIEFLMEGTFTGKVSTINKDGSPHIAPIWHILDEDNHVTFTTDSKSVKGRNLLRDPRISFCVDDQVPPFSFVIIEGIAEISSKSDNLLVWATKIAERYMGKKLSNGYGKRNAVEGGITNQSDSKKSHWSKGYFSLGIIKFIVFQQMHIIQIKRYLVQCFVWI